MQILTNSADTKLQWKGSSGTGSWRVPDWWPDDPAMSVQRGLEMTRVSLRSTKGPRLVTCIHRLNGWLNRSLVCPVTITPPQGGKQRARLPSPAACLLSSPPWPPCGLLYIVFPILLVFWVTSPLCLDSSFTLGMLETVFPPRRINLGPPVFGTTCPKILCSFSSSWLISCCSQSRWEQGGRLTDPLGSPVTIWGGEGGGENPCSSCYVPAPLPLPILWHRHPRHKHMNSCQHLKNI